MPPSASVSHSVQARCCGVCRYSCTSASCLCLDVDVSKGLPVYVVSLAQALQDVVQTNDSQAVEVVSSLTCYRGQRVPPISIHDYIERIAKYSKCSPICFIMAWSYLKRICGKETTELAVNSLTVHRLVISSVLIAVKMTDDRYYNNAFFAKIGGVALSELNVMELEMLKLLDFRTHVPASEIKWLLSRLKSLQGPGQVTSVLCRKRMTRSVDDLPAPKQREIQHEMNTPKAAWITSQQHTESNSAAQKGLNCRWQSAALQVPVKSAEMTCSPSNGIHLPQASVGVVNEPCSLQETKFKAFLVEISSIKVSV